MKAMLFSDVDGTLLDPHGDAPDNAAALAQLAGVLRENNIALALNSSRPVASLLASLAEERDLPRPDFICGAMGTQVADAQGQLLEGFAEEVGEGFDRQEWDALATELGMTPHPAIYQTPLKASFSLGDVEPDELRRRVGGRAKLVISMGDDVDLLPVRAGKQAAIGWLCARLGIDPAAGRVCVSGDSLNDVDMFAEPYRGIVVANAEAGLKQAAPAGRFVLHASRPVAAGVIEGLRHFGVAG
jgi:hydroxymethylpyrimidine pyrophosphatase-like HAD family hydrolase